ncbi:LamG domain-containing protein, partial [Verrucomicrobiota bacterium]
KTALTSARKKGTLKPSVISADLKKGLILYYSFDKNEGAKVIDKSGKENHGKVNGAKCIPDGKVGGAFEFDGKGDYIDLGRPVLETEKADHEITFVAWIKPDEVEADRRFVTQYDKSPSRFFWGHYRGKFRYFTGKGNVCSKTSLVNGKWQFIATTKAQDGTITHYLNGVRDGTGKLDGALARVSTTIGRRDATCYDGLIDELMIWTRTLSDKEIEQIYRAGGGK